MKGLKGIVGPMCLMVAFGLGGCHSAAVNKTPVIPPVISPEVPDPVISEPPKPASQKPQGDQGNDDVVTVVVEANGKASVATGSVSMGTGSSRGMGGGRKSAGTRHPVGNPAAATGSTSLPLPVTPATEAPAAGLPAPDYMARVSATEKIRLGDSGVLRVWLGLPDYVPQDVEGYAHSQSSIGTGVTARVKPFAAGQAVKIENIDTDAECFVLSPSGSEVVYRITPVKRQDFTVGAKVSLYASKDCSGPPQPRATSEIKVTVVMNGGGTFWDLVQGTLTKLVEFWWALLTMVLALLMVFARKRVRRLLGLKKGEGV